MNQIEFKILRRAQDNARETDKLVAFLGAQGVDLKQVKNNPDSYDHLIKEYSKACVNTGLFEESRERLELEFSKLCEYHRKNEAILVEQFYDVAKSIILSLPDSDRDK